MQHFVKDVIVRLSQARAEFVVVGGISAVLQGAPIVTVDLDICYLRQPDNLKRIAEALAPLKPRLRGIPADLPSPFDERSLQQGTNFTLEIGTDSLDLLAEMAAIGGYPQIVSRAEELPVAGCAVKVLSIADLIATKRAVGRPKDLATIPLLEATLATKTQQIPPAHDTTPGQ